MVTLGNKVWCASGSEIHVLDLQTKDFQVIPSIRFGNKLRYAKGSKIRVNELQTKTFG